MTSLKSLALDWLPPAFVQWLRRRRSGGIFFEGNFSTWEDAATRGTGYDAKSILAKVLDATRKVKRGEAAFERDSVLFDEIEYAWPVLAGLMCAAARNGGRLNVLDFGGSLGSSYFQNRKFLQTLPDVRWNVVEQAHYVEAGQTHIQDQQLRFYKSIEECLGHNKPNVVLLSSVLQYVSEPYVLLGKLLDSQSETFILDRTCYLNQEGNQMIRLQNVPSSIYSASYPCRFLDEDKISNKFKDKGYFLLESFHSLDKLDTLATWKGHIFLREKP